MQRNSTTDLDRVKAGAAFTWGWVRKIHEIGDYAIIEAEKYTYRNGHHDGQRHGDIAFYVYVKGEDMRCNYPTLDYALADAIAIKHEGVNSQAGHYFCKMVNIAV